MRSSRSQLDRFIVALHRRLLILRACEMLALGAATGAAVAAVLVPLLYWRDVDSLAPTIAVLALGAAGGLVWGLTHRPTVFDAAAEADRQLNLSDLLGTALRVRGRNGVPDRDAATGPWLQSVLSMADAACALHRPSQVMLRRLNARTWGAIVIAAGFVLTLSALTAQGPTARAASGGDLAGHLAEVARLPFEVDPLMPASSQRARAPAARSPGMGPERDAKDTTRRGAMESAATPDRNIATSSTAALARGDGGAGGGPGRARNARASDAPRLPDTRTSESAPQPGEAASGGGRQSSTLGNDASAPGAINGASAPALRGPPWQSAHWAEDVRRANEAIDSGRVPDAHRDLVRGYFDRR